MTEVKFLKANTQDHEDCSYTLFRKTAQDTEELLLYRLVIKYEAQTALFKDPVRTAQ